MKPIIVIFLFYCCLMVSCATIYKPDQKRSAATRLLITPADSLVKQQQQGVDFFAKGNDPVAWSLELDLEKGFSFTSGDNRLLIAPPVLPAANNEAETYLTKTDLGPLKLSIYKEPCAAAEHGKKSSLKTIITINNKRYTGCGHYLYDYLLNDIWTLQYIGNSEPGPSGSKKQLPWLEFDLEKNKMHGYDGCKDISSDITVEGNRIQFSSFATTKTGCAGNEVEKIFATLVSGHIVDYAIKDGRLVLILLNDNRLTFTKKE